MHSRTSSFISIYQGRIYEFLWSSQHPLYLAHWRTEKCLPPAAAAQVSLCQWYPICLAHLRTERCPPPAVVRQVSLFQPHVLHLNFCNASSCPYSAALIQVIQLSCIDSLHMRECLRWSVEASIPLLPSGHILPYLATLYQKVAIFWVSSDPASLKYFSVHCMDEVQLSAVVFFSSATSVRSTVLNLLQERPVNLLKWLTSRKHKDIPSVSFHLEDEGSCGW